MNANIVVPEDFATWQQSNPSPQEQIDYFNKHDSIRMPLAMWDKFFVNTLQHKGFHCSSCLQDEEYLGQPNFDDKCCCRSEN